MSTTGRDPDAVLAKVRKLLAKAEDPAATEQEARTYTAKAAALVAAWGIDAALLADADPDRDPVEDRRVPVPAPYAADKADLLGTVALRLRCQVVRLRTRDSDGAATWTLHLFGHRSDLDRAEVLFTSLLLQAGTRLLTTPVPAAEHPAAFRRSWLAGFTAAVSRRLAQTEDAAARDAGPRTVGRSTALVLADRGEAVRAAAEQAYPHARTARGRRLSGSGRAQGWDAGRRADLGGSRLGGRRPQLGPAGRPS